MLFLQLFFTVLVGLSVVLLLVATLAAIWERLRDGEFKKLGLKRIKPKTRRNDPKTERSDQSLKFCSDSSVEFGSYDRCSFVSSS